jgi:hypothetical protein
MTSATFLFKAVCVYKYADNSDVPKIMLEFGKSIYLYNGIIKNVKNDINYIGNSNGLNIIPSTITEKYSVIPNHPEKYASIVFLINIPPVTFFEVSNRGEFITIINERQEYINTICRHQGIFNVLYKNGDIYVT